MATFDKKALNAMRTTLETALERFNLGHADLHRLVMDLEPAVDAAESGGPQELAKAMRRAWGQLEIVNAVMLNEGRTNPNDSDAKEIDDAIRTIGELVGKLRP